MEGPWHVEPATKIKLMLACSSFVDAFLSSLPTYPITTYLLNIINLNITYNTSLINIPTSLICLVSDG